MSGIIHPMAATKYYIYEINMLRLAIKTYLETK
jgi:hypothetical protein